MEDIHLVALIRDRQNPSEILTLALITGDDERTAEVILTYQKKSWRRLRSTMFERATWFDVGTVNDRGAGIVAVCTALDVPRVMEELAKKTVHTKPFLRKRFSL